jgi:hypothetical protein
MGKVTSDLAVVFSGRGTRFRLFLRAVATMGILNSEFTTGQVQIYR